MGLRGLASRRAHRSHADPRNPAAQFLGWPAIVAPPDSHKHRGELLRQRPFLPTWSLGLLGHVVCALTSPVGNVAPNTHLLDQLGEHAVLLLCPLLALQGFVVLLEFLQALEGAAAGLPKAKQSTEVLLGLALT